LCVIIIYTYAYGDDWLGFQHDEQHTGGSTVNFSSQDIAPFWTFEPTQRIWDYKRGSSVWSSSVCIANVNGKDMVFSGLYNNNLYAIDAGNGNVIWRFIAGNRINQAPYFAVVNGRPTVFIASCDRTIYSIDALTGEKIWSYETLEWNYMVSEAIPSSPIVIFVDNAPLLVCAIWNSSHVPFNNFQKGELYVLDAVNGKKLYSKVLSSTPLNSPCFAYIKGEPIIFISSSDGNVFALNAKDGESIWKVTACSEVYSSPSVYLNETKETAWLFIGSRFGNLYCLDALTGEIIWTSKVGHIIDSTPAIAIINDDVLVYIGSYDRNVYCMDAKTGKEIWRFQTGDYVASSCAIAKIDGETAVFVHSLDNKLYCLNGAKGFLIQSFDLGKLIWGYNTRGDTTWSSPAVGMRGDKPILVFPCYDSKLYAFSAN